MLDRPAFRIVASAAVVALFYWGLFTGSVPAPELPATSRGMDADEAKSLAEKSRALIREDDYSGALAPLRTLHAKFPSSHIYIDELAIVFHHLSRPAEEAALLEEFLVKAPNPAEACPRLGLAYRATGSEEKAHDAFKRCLALAPDDPDAILYLALAEERAGNATEAAALYDRGLKLAPGYSDMRLGLARIGLRRGEAAKAKAAALAVLEKSPDNTDALLVAGLACLRSGEAAEAKRYLEHGLRLAPGNKELAQALAQAGATEHHGR